MEIPPEIRYVVHGAKSIAYQRWGSGDQRIVAIAPALATRGNVRLWSLMERAAASPGMVRTIHEATFAADVRDVLPLVSARVLVLRSVGHRLPEGVMRHVVDLLPNATYEELPETGSMAEFMAAYTRRTEQFMFGTVLESTGRVLQAMAERR